MWAAGKFVLKMNAKFWGKPAYLKACISKNFRVIIRENVPSWFLCVIVYYEAKAATRMISQHELQNEIQLHGYAAIVLLLFFLLNYFPCKQKLLQEKKIIRAIVKIYSFRFSSHWRTLGDSECWNLVDWIKKAVKLMKINTIVDNCENEIKKRCFCFYCRHVFLYK